MHARIHCLHASALALIIPSLIAATGLLSGCSSFTVTDPGFFTAISAASGTLRVNQQIQIANNAKERVCRSSSL